MQLTVQIDICGEFKFLLVFIKQSHQLRSHMQDAALVKGCTCQPPLSNASVAFLKEPQTRPANHQSNGRWWTRTSAPHWTCTHETRTNGRSDRRGNWHTVETGHNVGLTAITSKVIWTPDGEKQKPQKEREEVVEEGGGDQWERESGVKGGVKRRV